MCRSDQICVFKRWLTRKVGYPGERQPGSGWGLPQEEWRGQACGQEVSEAAGAASRQEVTKRAKAGGVEKEGQVRRHLGVSG